MRPATTALIDQADAASHQSARIMARLALLESTTVAYITPGPVHRAVLSRLHDKMLTGQLTLCPHLSWDAPAPAYWTAWAPGRLRCPPCATTASRRIRGTLEDRRCDHCAKIRPTIHRGAIELPPVVVDLPGRARCVPPITLLFGLCPPCQQANVEEAP